MGHKCYISFKTEDIAYKNHILEKMDIDLIDKSLNEPIDSEDEDYIMQVIRRDYLSDSTVTIFVIGNYSSESLGSYEQKYIKRELQASLFHGEGNTINGILGVVLPNMYDLVYRGRYLCSSCGNEHTHINVKNTTIKEFSYNYFIPKENKCSWSEDDRYCVLVKWDDFVAEPELYIERAFNKRDSDIADKITVRP